MTHCVHRCEAGNQSVAVWLSIVRFAADRSAWTEQFISDTESDILHPPNPLPVLHMWVARARRVCR